MIPPVHGRPTPSKPDTRARLLSACWAGLEPAESLEPHEREWLLYELWLEHWTDLEISVHMKQTEYTTARIRARLGLPVRRPRKGVAA